MYIVLPIGSKVGADTYRGIDVDREPDIQPPEGRGINLSTFDEERIGEVLELHELAHTFAAL